jgi:hypothetical protein
VTCAISARCKAVALEIEKLASRWMQERRALSAAVLLLLRSAAEHEGYRIPGQEEQSAVLGVSLMVVLERKGSGSPVGEAS